MRGRRRPARTPGALAPWQRHLLEVHIDTHLASPIKLRDLAALVRLSPSYFTVAFKRDFGETPRAYLNRRRIARAMELMLDTDEPLCRIAVACGLSDQSHFSRLFRKVQRTSPARWRRLRRGSPGPGLLSSGVSR
jgi:AraC-like DNA-binding protein